MTAHARQRLTAAEYLALERAADTKSEFFDGEMFAMSGASLPHNRITINVVLSLGMQLRGRPCEVLSTDMRLKVDPTGLYTYPDVLVVCGEAQLEDEHHDTLLNPTLIIEVLSPSTEAYDRGEKFAQYQRLASLQEYVLIAQDRHRVERFARQATGNDWLLTSASDLNGRLHLASIDCDLALADVYDRVELAPARRAHSNEPR